MTLNGLVRNSMKTVDDGCETCKEEDENDNKSEIKIK